MRYRDLDEPGKRQIRYGALVAVGVVVVAAGLAVLAHRVDPPAASASVEEAAAARGSRRTAAGPSPATASAATAQSASSDEVIVVNGLRRDAAVALIGDARRQAAAGNYSEAEASLARAEKAMPRFPEIRRARDDIARLRTPEGQLADRIQRARLAADHDDRAAAEAELAEAARLEPGAPEIAELRAALQAAHDKKARREARIADALARMREAIAQRDFAAANSALNEAERIDIQEPAIRQARSELARARNAPQ